MTQGWWNDDYYILFTPAEGTDAGQRYGLDVWLPGCVLIGLKSWDEFLVREVDGAVFTVPVVPLDRRYMRPAQLPPSIDALEQDARVEGKFRWWVKPIALGGDPSDPKNTAWVSPEQHVQVVRWWNEQYRAQSRTKR